MKQKIYSLIIVLTAILLFVSFSIICSEENNNDDFEVFITESTEISETAVCSTTETSTVKTESVHTSTSIKTETTETVQITSAVIISETFPETETVNFPIDINTAGIDELKALDGIGDSIALAIIEYRETYGNFRNREELLNVSGIGEKKLADIYDFIFVENETYDIPDDYYDDDDTQEVPEEYYEEQPEEPIESEESPETEFTEVITEETSENIMVNLNTAQKEDLMKLPYVDENIADDIIQLRETIEYFSHPYELLMVESLTQQQVAEIIKFVTVQ